MHMLDIMHGSSFLHSSSSSFSFKMTYVYREDHETKQWYGSLKYEFYSGIVILSLRVFLHDLVPGRML